jgi:TetR/AcrR family transcriptional regulator, tetracycline repressor protein
MPRRRGESLSLAQVLEAALKLVDEHGLAALSMRRLGSELGVDPMAIYYHVPGKQALIKALVERVFESFVVEGAETTWQEQMRRWAGAYRALALQHPNLVLEIVADPEAVATAARLADRSLHSAIKASGLPPRYQAAGADVIVDYVNGFVLGEVAIPGGAEEAFERGLDIIVAGLERLAADASMPC